MALSRQTLAGDIAAGGGSRAQRGDCDVNARTSRK